MKAKSRTFWQAGVAAAVALSAGAFVASWRRRWTARPEEVLRPMPLAETIKNPNYITHRAITIHARPEEVWPWIAQMGELPRGGYYSYVWVERLMGMKVENADRILPECQSLQIGQAIDRAGTMLVKACEPNRYLLLGPPDTVGLATVWAIMLYPEGDSATRLVSRVRARLDHTPQGIFWRLLLEPGQFWMERKMLLEIQKRAEAAGRTHRNAPGA